MKMAKASAEDLQMAMDICSALDSLERGFLPDGMTLDEEDYDERCHAQAVVSHLIELRSRGSLSRVVFGMEVLLDPRNRIVDPDLDCLELHPRLRATQEAA